MGQSMLDCPITITIGVRMRMNIILAAISFALCFALMFLGIIIAIYLETWLGLLLTATAALKFWHYLPQFNEEA
jgi:Zn-dependent membrane protease YugP